MLAIGVMLMGSAGASAAGPAVQVGQPFSNQPPSIAVDILRQGADRVGR